jgi:hypothetical protein
MRDASIGVLSRVPARALPAVPMATRTDLTLTAVDRDRIAYVSFATPLNQADGGKAAQNRSRSHNPVRTLTKPPAASETMLFK